MRDFQNEALLPFDRDDALRRAQTAALEAFRPLDCPLHVGGRRLRTRENIVSRDPCDPARIVGRAARAGKEQAGRAVEAAAKAFPGWSRVPARERAALLLRTAAILRRRRLELNATLILEVGKTWIEADADSAEAIDFCEYYAREMIRLDGEHPLVPVPGERGSLRYVPMGPALVVAPWNFPAAILAGMTAAALVTGNPVVLKPSSLAPAAGLAVVEAFEEAGLPPGVLNYLPCGGGEVGDLLVDDPRIRLVAFTGSREVGVRIHERAARVSRGQRWLKRTLIEMGGKDAILVDEDADPEAAAAGIVASAFGYQGQKCSACSRVVAVGPIYDRIQARVLELTETLAVGDAKDPDTRFAAVVDERQMKRILSYVSRGRREGRLLTGGRRLPRPGWFVAPTLFGGVKPGATLAREEIFGPVVALERARDIEHALRRVSDTDYGLTGAYYGRAHLDLARERFHVGNLYLNRKCTGALVGAHPFGGFFMSGTNAKAGGADYLRLFLEAKVCSERI
jgi:1-pyrroline-5-carboxylate dehydrogenase